MIGNMENLIRGWAGVLEGVVSVLMPLLALAVATVMLLFPVAVVVLAIVCACRDWAANRTQTVGETQ